LLKVFLLNFSLKFSNLKNLGVIREVARRVFTMEISITVTGRTQV